MDDTNKPPTEQADENISDDLTLEEGVILEEGEIEEIEEEIAESDKSQDDALEFDEDDGDLDEDDFAVMKFKRSHVYAALLPLAFVVGLALGYIFWGRSDSQPVAAPQVAAEDQGEVTRYDVSEDDDPVFGPKNAPITIIEFSDFECPYCRRWHVEVWPLLKETYGDQIRLVYRDFPLTNIHPNAIPAAAAANCAGDQDTYWEYNEALFSMALDLSKDSYLTYAEILGLDVEEFTTCLESGKYNEEVQADLEYAANLGIRSTPTFFVNGLPVVGAQPFEVFQQLIDQELAGAIP